jgi:hypothetical protein
VLPTETTRNNAVEPGYVRSHGDVWRHKEMISNDTGMEEDGEYIPSGGDDENGGEGQEEAHGKMDSVYFCRPSSILVCVSRASQRCISAKHLGLLKYDPKYSATLFNVSFLHRHPLILYRI